MILFQSKICGIDCVLETSLSNYLDELVQRIYVADGLTISTSFYKLFVYPISSSFQFVYKIGSSDNRTRWIMNFTRKFVKLEFEIFIEINKVSSSKNMVL